MTGSIPENTALSDNIKDTYAREKGMDVFNVAEYVMANQ